MLFEYISDNSTHIFFIQLLSADIHNFGLSANKSDQRTLMIKVYNLNKIIQPVSSTVYIVYWQDASVMLPETSMPVHLEMATL